MTQIPPIPKMTLADILTAEADLKKLKIAAMQEKLVCPEGGRHEWQYRGHETQTYRCLKCGVSITKGALKEATDA